MENITFKVTELIEEDNSKWIYKTVTNCIQGELYYNEEILVEGDSISELYRRALSYLAQKGVNLREIFEEKHIKTAENKTNEQEIPDQGIYVSVSNNNKDKFIKIKEGFKKLNKSNELLENYKFVLYKKDNNEENESEKKKGKDKNQNMSKKIEEIVDENIPKNKQIIFTGAPGTGKTWAVKSFVEKKQKEKKAHTDIYIFVQFHSSYDYTDFVEGLRPVPDKNGGNMFVRMDGIFKSFCRKIVKENLVKLSENKDKLMTIEEYYKDMNEEGRREEIYQKLNENPYYFIIDEINRADLSRVFGELMYGLEESYREIHNRFDTQYKNLSTYEMKGDKAAIIDDDCFKDGFFVPYNLYIIGTMNDIDRSVESFDFALRRRFVWIDIKANDFMCESLKSMRDKKEDENLSDDEIKEISDKICQMNKIITEFGYGLSEAYHIGPAYFKDLVNVSDKEAESELSDIFENRIEPILREYMRGRKSGAQDKLIKSCRDKLLGKKDEKN